MWFSRIWLILLALALAAAVGATMLVGKPDQRQLGQLHQRNIDQVQLNTDLVLQLEARRWIDATGTMATDSALIQAMQQTARGADEVTLTSGRVRQRLLSLRDRMDANTRPSLLIAVDGLGKQIARVGPGDTKFRPGVDGLAGYPVIEDALRGYRRDDSWNIEGKLYFVSASPIIAPGLRRYVGALLIGREVNDAYAKTLKGKIGSREPTDIAFYLRGKMVASTVSSTSLHTLPTRYAKMKKQIAKNSRSAPILLGDDEDNPHHLVVFAPLPGEASLHNTFYAVVAKPRQFRSPLAALKAVSRSDLSLSRFPWLVVGGLFLGLVVFGLLLVAVEWGRPTRHLRSEVQDVASGLAARVDEVRYSGRLHAIARHINEALLRNTRTTTTPGRDVNEVLGNEDSYLTRPALRLDDNVPNDGNLTHLDGVVERTAEPVVVIDSPAKRSSFPPPVLPPAFDNLDLEKAPTRAENLAFATNPNIPLLSPIDLASTPRRPLPRAEQPDDDDDTLALDPPLPEPRFSGGRPSTAEDDDTELPAGVEPMPILETPSSIDDLLSPLTDDLMPRDTADKDASMSETKGRLKSISGRVTSDSLAEAAAAALKAAERAAPSKSDSGSGADDDEPLLDEYLKQVFDEFVSIKQQCGESVKELTFEKFAGKLLKNRADLIERFSCRRVRFSVYIKDGKAAIKATPVME